MYIFPVFNRGSLLLSGQNITYNNQSITYGDEPDSFYTLLPDSAKYFSCTVNTHYNSNHDIVWSFKYSVSGTVLEYGIGAFLTAVTPYIMQPTPFNDYLNDILTDDIQSNNISMEDTAEDVLLPGQYMCTTATNQSLFTPTINIISGGEVVSYAPYNIISISIDTKGACGLSSEFRPGVSTSSLSANTLTIRDIANNVIYYQAISSSIFEAEQNHIFRCIYSNSNQTLQVDYRNEKTLDFSTIALCNLDYYIINDDNNDFITPGVSFCSPISSLVEPCTLQLYNLHHEGVANNTAVEILTSTFVS